MAAAAPDRATAPPGGGDDDGIAVRPPAAPSAKARVAAEGAEAAKAFAQVALAVWKRKPHHAADSGGQSAISSVNACEVLNALISTRCTPNNVCTPSQLGNPALSDVLTVAVAAVKFASTGKTGKGVVDTAFRDFRDPRQLEHFLLHLREVPVKRLAAGLDDAMPGVRGGGAGGHRGPRRARERPDRRPHRGGGAGSRRLPGVRAPHPPFSDSPHCVSLPQTPIGVPSCESPPPCPLPLRRTLLSDKGDTVVAPKTRAPAAPSARAAAGSSGQETAAAREEKALQGRRKIFGLVQAHYDAKPPVRPRRSPLASLFPARSPLNLLSRASGLRPSPRGRDTPQRTTPDPLPSFPPPLPRARGRCRRGSSASLRTTSRWPRDLTPRWARRCCPPICWASSRCTDRCRTSPRLRARAGGAAVARRPRRRRRRWRWRRWRRRRWTRRRTPPPPTTPPTTTSWWRRRRQARYIHTLHVIQHVVKPLFY
jgi:hypothetical protein